MKGGVSGAAGRPTGPRNRTVGAAWEDSCLTFLRDRGAPHAERKRMKHGSDLTGVGDTGIECTTRPWDDTGMKLDQAAADAARRGFTSHRVWKPRRAREGERRRPVGEGFAVMTIEQDWAREQLIAELERDIAVLRKLLKEAS